jgi:membrane protein DedA with SNARE-associated domain
MPIELITSISLYGYLAIFVLVFLQEIGFPHPIPNELVLLFSGFLAYSGVLNFILIVLSAIAGDLLASSILYTIFYLFGQLILQKKPGWIPISIKKINRFSGWIERRGTSGIFIGRLSPFIRGYTSVLSGLLHISPKKYSIILGSTATIWAFSYVTIGFIIGPYWELYMKNSPGNYTLYIGFVFISILILMSIFLIIKRFLARAE